jgi:hypothetical protein
MSTQKTLWGIGAEKPQVNAANWRAGPGKIYIYGEITIVPAAAKNVFKYTLINNKN